MKYNKISCLSPVPEISHMLANISKSEEKKKSRDLNQFWFQVFWEGDPRPVICKHSPEGHNTWLCYCIAHFKMRNWKRFWEVLPALKYCSL